MYMIEITEGFDPYATPCCYHTTFTKTGQNDVLIKNMIFWVKLKIPHKNSKIPQFSELGAGFPALFQICRYSPV